MDSRVETLRKGFGGTHHVDVRARLNMQRVPLAMVHEAPKNVLLPKQIKVRFSASDAELKVHTYIADGSFGQTYLARERRTDADVVIKLFKTGAQDEVSRVQAVLEHNEMTLRHPNIVDVYFCSLLPMVPGSGSGFLLMEYVPNGELFEYIVCGRPLPDPLARRFIRQLLSAMAHMHGASTYHRDIKPENMLIDGHANLKLCDFGSLKTVAGPGESADKRVSRRGSTPFGSTAFMPPEVNMETDMLGLLHKEAGFMETSSAGSFFDKYRPAKVDMWSVGAVAFTLLGCQRPFDHSTLEEYYLLLPDSNQEGPSANQRFWQHWTQLYESLGLWLPFGAEAIDFINCMLQLRAEDRQSAQELLLHPWIMATDLKPDMPYEQVIEELQGRVSSAQFEPDAAADKDSKEAPPPDLTLPPVSVEGISVDCGGAEERGVGGAGESKSIDRRHSSSSLSSQSSTGGGTSSPWYTKDGGSGSPKLEPGSPGFKPGQSLPKGASKRTSFTGAFLAKHVSRMARKDPTFQAAEYLIDGRTLLYHAIRTGSADTLEELLFGQASATTFNVNEPDPVDGLCPVSRAAANGFEACVRILLRVPDLDVNQETPPRGLTPLIFAAAQGHTKCLESLVGADKIDINKVDTAGQTALFAAAYRGHVDCVALLLRTPGVEATKANEDGMTPLFIAASTGHEGCAALLLQDETVQINQRTTDKHQYAALHVAAEFGYKACVQNLLEAGADVNIKDARGQTALHLAVLQEHVGVVNLLIATAGVNLNEEDAVQGTTPLDIAIAEHQEELQTILVKAGAAGSQAARRVSLTDRRASASSFLAGPLRRRFSAPDASPDAAAAAATVAAHTSGRLHRTNSEAGSGKGSFGEGKNRSFMRSSSWKDERDTERPGGEAAAKKGGFFKRMFGRGRKKR